jgi:hypothetical protein
MDSGGGMFGIVDGSLRVSIKTDRPHLREVVELVGDVLRHPAFPVEELEIVKKENLADYEERLSQPMSLGLNGVMRRLSPWPPDDARLLSEHKSLGLIAVVPCPRYHKYLCRSLFETYGLD